VQRGFELQESQGRHPALGHVVHEAEHDLHGLLLGKTADIAVGRQFSGRKLFAAPVHEVQGMIRSATARNRAMIGESGARRG